MKCFNPALVLMYYCVKLSVTLQQYAGDAWQAVRSSKRDRHYDWRRGLAPKRATLPCFVPL